MKYLLVPLLIMQCLMVYSQDSTTQQIVILSRSDEHITKKKDLPVKIYYKSKNSKGIKKRAVLYDLRNDTLICKSKTKSPDTLFLAWNDLKWVQVERTTVHSLLYDGALLFSYYGAISSAYLFTSSMIAYPTNNSASANLILGFYGTLVFIPTAIIFTKCRFREFKPQNYQIKKRLKVTKH